MRHLANSFPVRKLTRPRQTWLERFLHDGAAQDVECVELRFSSADLEVAIESRQIRTSDLVEIRGVWTPISEAPQFAELALPHARREHRLHTWKSALENIAFLSFCLGVYALIAFVFHCPHCP